eukprot:11180550-Prorocentrum_lima.AAC.1
MERDASQAWITYRDDPIACCLGPILLWKQSILSHERCESPRRAARSPRFASVSTAKLYFTVMP